MGKRKMKKIPPIIITVLLFITGFGANAAILKPCELNDDYDLVIIAPDLFSDTIQPLIDHKNALGIQTLIKTTQDIYSEYEGRDEAEQIKYFIKDAIESYNIQYVLLVGGRQGQHFKWYVPCRYSNVDDGYMHKQFLSDLYFADIYKTVENETVFEDWDANKNGIFAEWIADNSSLDEMDLIPDVAVGRLPCRNTKEVATVVEKIIDYETTTYGKAWFNNALLIGGDTNPGLGDPFPFEGEADCEYTKQLLDGFTITTLYTSDETLTSHDDFISSFNTGNGFVLYHGHGLQDSLVTHDADGEQIQVFDNKYIPLLTNEGSYPIMVAGCCLTTEFDVGILNFLTIVKNIQQHHYFRNCKYECVFDVIGWNMIKKPDGGSIAHIASSSTAWGADGDKDLDGIPDSVQYGFTTGLCAEFFRIFDEGELDILGDVYAETLTRIIENNNATEERVQCKCVQEFQLLGDPSLKIGGYPTL
jgi:hypothetical protein